MEGCNESTESRHRASEPARSPYQHSDSLEDVLGPWGLVPAPLYMGEQGRGKDESQGMGLELLEGQVRAGPERTEEKRMLGCSWGAANWGTKMPVGEG